jgi:hypothetical protein
MMYSLITRLLGSPILPGLCREYLDKKNKKAREDRAEKTAAKKRKMDNEYDSDDDSD